MNISPASESDLMAPKFDRRKENKGRTPLVDISQWKPFERLDLSGYRGEDAAKVARSLRSQARKRGWAFREIAWNVYVRFPVYIVSCAGEPDQRVVGRDERDAIMTASQGRAGEWVAVLQE